MTSVRLVVELPSHDSDREGTLLDVRDALARLKHVSNEVFSRVESRVAEEAAMLQALEQRVEAVRQKIAALAAQPSKATSLQVPSKLVLLRPNVSSVFKDLPVQAIGRVDANDYRFKGRKNADQDDDPAVPVEALIDMDRRITASVAQRIREAAEQTRELAQDISSAVSHNDDWLMSLAAGRDAEDTDEEDLGPPPASLKQLACAPEEGEGLGGDIKGIPEEIGLSTIGIEGNRPVDVAYRPRTKEAHHLGLPPSLTSLLPDIADPSSFLSLARHTPSIPTPPLDEGVPSSKANQPARKTTVDSISDVGGAEDTKDENVGLVATPASIPIREKKNPVGDQEQVGPKSPQVAGIPVRADQPRLALMAAIREAKTPGKPHKSEGGGSATQAKTVKKPITLADEMREKLARRQKVLSGERDEEEQHAERLRRKNITQFDEADDQSTDSGLSSSLPSYSPALKPAPAGLGKSSASAKPPVSETAPFAGLDALLKRELSSKAPALFRPPPKPASSVGDWDED